MMPNPEEVIAEISTLGRYSLGLEFMRVSHGQLELRVFSEGDDNAYLSFSAVDSLDIPTRLTNVELSFSIENRKDLPRYKQNIPTFKLVCDEGIFCIKARYLWYLKGDKYQELRDFIEHSNSLRMWEDDGVSIEDLPDWLVDNDY